MAHLAADDLNRMFQDAADASSAIRAIVPHYNVGNGGSATNSFIFEKTVQHFRNHDKPDGVYRLGHGLELVLGESSCIREEVPF